MLRRLRLKLASQFTLLLSLIFVGSIALGGFALSKALNYKAQVEISYRGQMMMQMVNSVRSYTNDRITPLLTAKTEPQTQLIPETIPSFAARQVFETLRQNPKYQDLVYKGAMLNPTNMDDKADRFEAKLIERFQEDRRVKTFSGFRVATGTQLFYTAQPLLITNHHATPNHVEQYGTQNEIIGTQIIYIPASEVFESAHQALVLFICIFILLFATVILLINHLLKRRVIQPLKTMAQLADQISLGSVLELQALEHRKLERVARRTDELGQLGRVFQKMVQEISAREQQLSEQMQQLRVEIDQTKRLHQFAEIAETDYFQKLQQTAKEIRDQWTEPT